MNKNILILLLLLSCTLPLSAQSLLSGQAEATNVKIERMGEERVQVSMDIDITHLHLKSNQSVILTPLLQTSSSIEELPPVEIVGRKRYYTKLRTQKSVASSQGTTIRKKNEETQVVSYSASVPYRQWMDLATLEISEDLCGCCNTPLESTNSLLASTGWYKPEFSPKFVYAQPQVEARKTRSEFRSASLKFPVNITFIHPSYLENSEELAKVNATIQLVKEDPDVRIESISIKGYASPEGPYKNNERLAKGRTEALAGYLRKSHSFESVSFRTEHEAEDWAGLRDCVLRGNLKEKDELLAVIDSSLEPDAKDRKLKSDHPDAYQVLFKECYPHLRRCDYTISYIVRGFNVDEARELLQTHPQKLSLQEMFLVAQTYEPGTPAYNNVFRIAVSVFPDDAHANLNAANIALMGGDLVGAEKYLSQSGNSPEAIHARGILAALKGEHSVAERLLEEAASKGIPQAKENLESLKASY